MVQLNILSGKKAGAIFVARRFPVRIGRAATAELQLEGEGVWERHLELRFVSGRGLVLQTQGEALAAVNGQPVQETLLHSGDIIDVGSAKLQFWMAETRQRALALREAMAWILIGSVLLSQIALLYWLLN